MTDYPALLAMRDDNERDQLKILANAVAGYEANYARYSHGPLMRLFDPMFNRGLRRETDKHIAESTQLTLGALRMSSRQLAAWHGLTEDQRVELGRYGIGTSWEGNVYLEEKG
jgi:hypothetical protein